MAQGPGIDRWPTLDFASDVRRNARKVTRRANQSNFLVLAVFAGPEDLQIRVRGNKNS